MASPDGSNRRDCVAGAGDVDFEFRFRSSFSVTTNDASNQYLSLTIKGHTGVIAD